MNKDASAQPATGKVVKPAVRRTDSRNPGAGEQSEPQLPHEADQSASNQHTDNVHNIRIGRQAKADIDRGLVDTGPAPVMDKLNRKEFGPARDTPKATGKPK